MQPQQGVIEVCASHCSQLLLSKVRGVKPASQDKEADMTPREHRIANWNSGGMHTPVHTGCVIASIMGNSLQLTHEEE